MCGKPPHQLGVEDLGPLGNALAALTPLSPSRRKRLAAQGRSLSRMLYEAGMSDRPAPGKQGKSTDRLGGVATEAIRETIAS